MLKLLYLSLFAPFFAYSQIEIRGTVKDSLNTPIEFANVFLTNQSNDIVTGTITDQRGDFNLPVKKGSYTLTISFMGYEDWTQEVTLNENKDFGNIMLSKSKNKLNEVVVAARKPLVERKVDRLVFNVENSIISKGTVWEVLKKTPSLITTSSGGLQIMGKDRVKIMINDRILQLSEEEIKSMLDNMSADNVKSIEVITIPPAKYDAEGSGLVNIRLNKNSGDGVKVNLKTDYEQSVKSKFNNGISFFYKKKKLSLTSNYNLRYGQKFREDQSDIVFIDENDNEVSTIWNEEANVKSNYLNHNYRFFIDYQIFEKTTLSAGTTGVIKPYSDSETNSKTYVRNNESIINSIFKNNNRSESKTDNLSYNFSLSKKFNQKGHELSFNVDFINYDNDRGQMVNTNFFDADEILNKKQAFRLTNEQKIDINTISLDYTLPLDSISVVNIGAKVSNSKTKNYLKYFDINENNESNINIERSDNFKYDENILAGYISFSSNLDKLYYKVGLRYEHTNNEGINGVYQGETSKFKNNYKTFFPTIYLQYQINKKNTVGFAYGRRIQRPNYRYLNPFKNFYSPYSFFEGNPFLKPAISTNFELSYYLLNKYFFTTFFKKTKDPFTQLSLQDNNDNLFKYTVVNLTDDLSYGLSFSTSHKISSWWTTYFSFNTYYKESNFINPLNQETIKKSNWNFDPFFGNEITLSKKLGISIENINRYISPKVQGGFDIKSRLNVSFGFTKSLLNDKASFALYIEDLFNSNNFELSSQYSNQNHQSFENIENQFIRFSFSYKFGSDKLKQSKRDNKSQEEKDRLN